MVKMMVSPGAFRPDIWRERRTQNRQYQDLCGSPTPWGPKVRIPDIKTKLWRRLHDSCPTWRRMSPRSWPSPPRACPGRRRCSPEAPTPPSPLSPHVCLRQFYLSKYFPSHFMFRLLFLCTIHHFFQKLFFYWFVWNCLCAPRFFGKLVWTVVLLHKRPLQPTILAYVFEDKIKKVPSLPSTVSSLKDCTCAWWLSLPERNTKVQLICLFHEKFFFQSNKIVSWSACRLYENLLADTKFGI